MIETPGQNRTTYIGGRKKDPLPFPESYDLKKLLLFPTDKFYEWGPDPIVQNTRKGFAKETLNTLRFEHMLYRAILPKGIDTLQDFLRDCQFRKIIKNSFKLRKFKEISKGYPMEWDEYSNNDLGGFNNCFQVEYNNRKDSNPTQHMIEPFGFDDFKFKLYVTMQIFDANWRKNYKLKWFD